MSQVFSADAVGTGTAATLPTSGETTALTGNFLSPPFQNAKGLVIGFVSLTLGASTTAVLARIRRNPNAENVNVAGTSAVTATGGNTVALTVVGADTIPDGRPVQYAVTVTPTGASATGTIIAANVTAFLISG